MGSSRCIKGFWGRVEGFGFLSWPAGFHGYLAILAVAPPCRNGQHLPPGQGLRQLGAAQNRDKEKMGRSKP